MAEVLLEFPDAITSDDQVPPEWQRYVWTVRPRLWDEYFAALT